MHPAVSAMYGYSPPVAAGPGDTFVPGDIPGLWCYHTCDNTGQPEYGPGVNFTGNPTLISGVPGLGNELAWEYLSGSNDLSPGTGYSGAAETLGLWLYWTDNSSYFRIVTVSGKFWITFQDNTVRVQAQQNDGSYFYPWFPSGADQYMTIPGWNFFEFSWEVAGTRIAYRMNGDTWVVVVNSNIDNKDPSLWAYALSALSTADNIFMANGWQTDLWPFAMKTYTP